MYVWALFVHSGIVISITPFQILHKQVTSYYNCSYHCINNIWAHCIHLFPFLNFLLSSCSLLNITANPAINRAKENIATKYIIIGSRISANIVDSNNAVTIYLAISKSHLPNSFFIAAKIRQFWQTSKHLPRFFSYCTNKSENDC